MTAACTIHTGRCLQRQPDLHCYFRNSEHCEILLQLFWLGFRVGQCLLVTSEYIKIFNGKSLIFLICLCIPEAPVIHALHYLNLQASLHVTVTFEKYFFCLLKWSSDISVTQPLVMMVCHHCNRYNKVHSSLVSKCLWIYQYHIKSLYTCTLQINKSHLLDVMSHRIWNFYSCFRVETLKILQNSKIQIKIILTSGESVSLWVTDMQLQSLNL